MVAMRELLTHFLVPGRKRSGHGGCSLFYRTIARSAGNEHGNGRDIDFSVDGNDPLSSLCSGKLRTYDTVQVVGSI